MCCAILTSYLETHKVSTDKLIHVYILYPDSNSNKVLIRLPLHYLSIFFYIIICVYRRYNMCTGTITFWKLLRVCVYGNQYKQILSFSSIYPYTPKTLLKNHSVDQSVTSLAMYLNHVSIVLFLLCLSRHTVNK